MADALDGPECQVALTALDGAEIGAMYPEHVCVGLLGVPQSLAVRPETLSEIALEVTFHQLDSAWLLRNSLQTHK